MPQRRNGSSLQPGAPRITEAGVAPGHEQLGHEPPMTFGEEREVLALVAHDAFELERATPHEGTKVPADEGLGTEPR
jgi:hypothetical protein